MRWIWISRGGYKYIEDRIKEKEQAHMEKEETLEGQVKALEECTEEIRKKKEGNVDEAAGQRGGYRCPVCGGYSVEGMVCDYCGHIL